jgi:Transposase DDE domain
MVDAAGVPLTVTLTGGNRNDITQLLLLVDRITPVVGRIGCPRQRPDQIVADRGYDHDSYRRKLWRRGVKPSIAQCGTEHGAFLTLTCALICRRYLGGFETGSKLAF